MDAFFPAGDFLAALNAPLTHRLKQNDTTLRELRGFGLHTVDEISSAIVENATVTSFMFNNCELDDAACAKIMQALIFRHAINVKNSCMNCRPRTKRLSFARNRIGAAGAQEIASFILSPSAGPCPEQEDNGLSVYWKSKTGCETCGNELLLSPRFMEDFITLQLLSNNIGDEGAAAVADAIATCDANDDQRSHCIVELGLERNCIGDVGLIPISRMLKTNYSLYRLHLDKNAISHEGMVYLSEALKTNHKLEVLSLTGNKAIGDEGLKLLGESLKCNWRLKTLLIKNCGISDRGATYLLEALYCDQSPSHIAGSNHSLTEVSLSSKNVYYCLAKASLDIPSSCEVHPQRSLSLKTLLSWNSLGSEPSAYRFKLGFFLCSGHGVKQVHSLELDKKLFPTLLCKLWKTSSGEYFSKIPANMEVIWCYLRGMPEIFERQKPSVQSLPQA